MPFFPRLALVALPLGLAASFASAQAQPDEEAMIAAARNQLGVLEYCQEKGHIEAAAVEAQKTLLAQLPTPKDATKAEEAHAKGRAGTISAMGTDVKLDDAAMAQNSDTATFCKTIGTAVTEAIK